MKLRTLGLLSASFVVAQLMTMNAMATTSAGFDAVLGAKEMVSDGTITPSQTTKEAKARLVSAITGGVIANSVGLHTLVTSHAQHEAENGAEYTSDQKSTHAELGNRIAAVQGRQDVTHATLQNLVEKTEGGTLAVSELPPKTDFSSLGNSMIQDHSLLASGTKTTRARALTMFTNSVHATQETASPKEYDEVTSMVNETRKAQIHLAHGKGGMKEHHDTQHTKKKGHKKAN